MNRSSCFEPGSWTLRGARRPAATMSPGTLSCWSCDIRSRCSRAVCTSPRSANGTGCGSRPRTASYPEDGGRRLWSRPKRCVAGTGRWCGESGRTDEPPPGRPRIRRKPWSSSSTWTGRTAGEHVPSPDSNTDDRGLPVARPWAARVFLTLRPSPGDSRHTAWVGLRVARVAVPAEIVSGELGDEARREHGCERLRS